MEALFDLYSGVSHRFVELGLNSIGIGLLLVLAVWFLLKAASRLNAATRYSIWWVTLGLVIVVPIAVGPLDRVLESGSGPPAPEIAPAVEAADADLTLEKAAGLSTAVVIDSMIPTERIPSTPSIPDGRSIPSLVAGFVPLAVFALWGTISFLLLIRLARAQRRLLRVKAGSTPLHARSRARIDSIVREAFCPRQLTVRLSREVGYPAAAGLGKPMILLPATTVERLSNRDLEAILLHEIAHIARRDDWARLVQKIVGALFFFHPAVILIGRQLDLERELACDEQVLASTGVPADYCRCLTRLLQLAGPERISLAAGVLSGRRQIFNRFERLLARPMGQDPRFSRFRFAAAAAMVAIVFCLCVSTMPVMALPMEALKYGKLAPDIASTPCESGEDDDESQKMFIPSELADTLTDLPAGRIVDWSLEIYNLPISFTLRSTDGKNRIASLWCLEDRNLRVVTRGPITFTTDDRAIESVSPLGFLAISDGRHGDPIQLEVRAGAEGKPVYSLFETGSPRAIGNAEREWIADIVLTLVRDCGFGAKERAARILETAGLATLLAEIHEIQSDRVKSEYIVAVFELPGLARDGMRAAIRMIGSEIDDNHAKCALLTAVKPRLIQDPGLLPCFAEAFKTMEMDYLARKTLTSLGSDPDAGELIIVDVLALSAHLPECGRIKLLVDLASRCGAVPALRKEYLDRVDTIDAQSDRKVLLDALEGSKRKHSF